MCYRSSKSLHELMMNRSRLLIQIMIFCLFSFYILGTAMNLLLFHFIIDINLAKVGMLFMIVGLLILNWKEHQRLGKELQLLLIIIFFWMIYLIANSYLGATPKVSFKMMLRVIGVWIIAFETCLLLQKNDEKYRWTVIAALFFSLFVISIIWYLDYSESKLLHDLAQDIADYRQHNKRVNGLYLNPNELGFALVAHTLVLVWYSFHPIFSGIIIPITTVISLIGIVMSQSRNSFVGLCIVSTMVVSYYFGGLFRRFGWKTAIVSIMICTSLFVVILKQDLVPNRIKSTAKQATQIYQKLSVSNISTKRINKLTRPLPAVGMRIKIWMHAFEKWKKRPWIGVGLGSFVHIQQVEPSIHHTTHNFLFSVLVEQGIIGFGFLLLFTFVLIITMRNLGATLMLLTFPMILLFDDLSPSYTFPIYVSLILGYCFHICLSKKIKSSSG